MILQVVFTLFFGDTKASPFTVEITQLAHGNCWSKYLIAVFNRLRLCTCYTSMERIDTSLTQRIITEVERHRVPVSSKLIHGAMNNYDNAGSHDFPFDSCIPSMTRGTFTDEYLKWLFLRYNTSKDETNETNTQKISSFSSLKTSLTSVNLRCITLTPISPYSTTNYYVIYMVMVNFQDVLQ